MLKKKKKPKRPDCRKCDGQCCRYFALQIDSPKSKKSIDHIRWFLAHKKISIFVDGKEWFAQVWNPCRYLTRASKCSIYNHRPTICREYGSDISRETCVDSPEAHDLYFDTPEDFEKYICRHL